MIVSKTEDHKSVILYLHHSTAEFWIMIDQVKHIIVSMATTHGHSQGFVWQTIHIKKKNVL